MARTPYYNKASDSAPRLCLVIAFYCFEIKINKPSNHIEIGCIIDVLDRKGFSIDIFNNTDERDIIILSIPF